MLKIRQSRDRLIFNMGIAIPEKDGLYIETGPQCIQLVCHEQWPQLFSCGCWANSAVNYSTNESIIYYEISYNHILESCWVMCPVIVCVQRFFFCYITARYIINSLTSGWCGDNIRRVFWNILYELIYVYMRQYSITTLLQIMTCCLIGTKPLSELMLPYCQLDP